MSDGMVQEKVGSEERLNHVLLERMLVEEIIPMAEKNISLAVGRKPYEQTHLKAMDDPDFNNYFHTFFRCIGDNDCFRSRFLEEDAIIQEKGVHEIRKIYPGGHDWNVWRPCFTDFAQMIFR